MIRLAWLLVLLAVAAAPAGSRASPPRTDAKAQAQLHLDRASALHTEGKLPEVLRELTLAYSLDPKPDLLYAIAQVHVQLGQCEQAILFYERFLSTQPDVVPAAAASEAIEVCRTAPGSVATTAAAPPAELQPPPSPQVERGPGRRDRWYTDKLGGVLLAGGIALGAVAAPLYLSARGDLDDAESAGDYEAHGELVESARGKRGIAVVLAAGGGVLVGAAVVRYLLRRPPSSGARAGIGIAPAPGGGLATWSGRF
jgi:tetratricopeptide (TPR) repeat protein